MEKALAQAFANWPEMLQHLPQFAAHWQLVKQWNKRINLTAINDDTEAAWLHYRDCAEILKLLKSGAVVDMGSGAGFPGIVLAIAWQHPITLVEPRRKRVSFLRTAKAKLGLKHVHIIEGRSTDAPDKQYENIVTRATFSSNQDLRDCMKWSTSDGQLIAMRSESGTGDTQSPTTIHPYKIRQSQRALEIWQAEEKEHDL